MRYTIKEAVHTLQSIVSRKGSSKILTFNIPHVYKALQLLANNRYTSRATFGQEIHLGEGAVKTLISHLKEKDIIESVQSGSYLTPKGKMIIKAISRALPKECDIKDCKLVPGPYNHAIIVREHVDSIRVGIEQRDYAVRYGAISCSTILFIDSKFVFPRETNDCFYNDIETRDYIMSKLSPKESDIVIIASAQDPFVSEIAAKNAALLTLVDIKDH